MRDSLKLALEQVCFGELEKIPGERELAEQYEFTAEFDNRMNNLIRRTNRRYVRVFGHTVRRAVVAAVLVIALISSSMGFKIIRDPVIELLIVVDDKMTDIIFTTNMSILDDDEIGILYYKYPDLPDEYELVSESRSILTFFLNYESPSGILEYSQYIASGTLSVDTEGTELEYIKINNVEAMFFANKGYNNIIWVSGRYIFYLSGTIDKNEIIEIAKKNI